MEMYEKSLAIRLKVLGEAHPDVGNTYYNIATLYQTKHKDMRAAKTHYDYAYQTYRRCCGETRSKTVDAKQARDACEV